MDADTRRRSLPNGRRLNIDDAGRLAEQFRYWHGASGARYVFTEIDVQEIDDYPETVVLVLDARRRSALRLAYLGEIDCASETPDQALAEARDTSSMRAFVHLLAETPERRQQVIADLAAAA
ncbi:MAG: hypothetical protein AAGL24_15580 [Pseudomonadota bacterium]